MAKALLKNLAKISGSAPSVAFLTKRSHIAGQGCGPCWIWLHSCRPSQAAYPLAQNSDRFFPRWLCCAEGASRIRGGCWRPAPLPCKGREGGVLEERKAGEPHNWSGLSVVGKLILLLHGCSGICGADSLSRIPSGAVSTVSHRMPCLSSYYRLIQVNTQGLVVVAFPTTHKSS